MTCHATTVEKSDSELYKAGNLHHGCIRKDFHKEEKGVEDAQMHRCSCGAVWADKPVHPSTVLY